MTRHAKKKNIVNKMNAKQSEECICGVVGPIRNLARIARLEDGCKIIRGLSIQKKPSVIRCAIKNTQNKNKNPLLPWVNLPHIY
jgi:hypothetical protein